MQKGLHAILLLWTTNACATVDTIICSCTLQACQEQLSRVNPVVRQLARGRPPSLGADATAEETALLSGAQAFRRNIGGALPAVSSVQRVSRTGLC
jgi:hypothetical protein